jgi:hypothetical protein
MNGRQIIAALADLTRRICLDDIKRPGIVKELHELADAVSGEAKEDAAQPKTQEMLDSWKRIFAHWQTATDHPKARPTKDRQSKVYARLREGFSERDIIRAIDGCASSPFHMGENDGGVAHNDLSLVCRSGSKLEGFIDRAGEDTGPREGEDPRVAKLEAQAMKALNAGDTETYNGIMADIEGIHRAG